MMAKKQIKTQEISSANQGALASIVGYTVVCQWTWW